MNPHTYQRKHAEVPAQPSLSRVVLETFVKTPISSAIAFAMIVFAAGSVLAMTAVAVPQIAMGDDGGAIIHVAKAQVQTEVLDASTAVTAPIIDDSALEAVDPTASMSFKPASFNADGRWDYKIMYYASNLTGTGQLDIGTFVLSQNLNATGTVETGAILKPSHEYRVSFWEINSDGTKDKIQSQILRTPKGSSKTEPCYYNTLLCPPIVPKPIPCPSTAMGTPGTAAINCLPPPCITNSTGASSGSGSTQNCVPLPPCMANATSTTSGSGTIIHCLPFPPPCYKDQGSAYPCQPPVVCPLGQNCPPLPTSTPPSTATTTYPRPN